MKPQYLAFVGATPEIVGLDVNCTSFQVLIRCDAGVTLEATIDNPDDSVSQGGLPPVNPNAPVWQALTLDAAGYINMSAGEVVAAGLAPGPWRAVRFTPTAGGAATILQQGVR
jgi:hypothetical protein